MNTEDTSDFHFWHATDLIKQSRYPAALSHILAALEYEPRHLQALALAGELHLLYAEDLGIELFTAYNMALCYFDRALAQEPQYADAWSGKALTLLYLERPEEALAAAEEGLSVLPARVGYAMTSDEVYTNVMEALYDRKISALEELGRLDEARKALSTGLECCPGSIYLTRHVEAVTPLFQLDESDNRFSE